MNTVNSFNLINASTFVKRFLFLIPLLFAILLPVTAFAQSSYDVNIPTGSADPAAPYFWQNEKDGSTSGVIEIIVGDTITWKNADTTFHDVTSGSEDTGPDGIFASKPLAPGKSFSQKFSEIGVYPFYCTLHPWMTGVVNVVKDPGSVRSIPNVASGYSDDGLGFEVKYILDASLEENVRVDTTENALIFRIDGDTENEQITLILPPELIENPNLVLVDDVQTDFEIDTTSSGIKLTVPIEFDSKEIKIIGTSVIPEFGPLAMMILGISVVVMIVMSQKFKIKI